MVQLEPSLSVSQTVKRIWSAQSVRAVTDSRQVSIANEFNEGVEG